LRRFILRIDRDERDREKKRPPRYDNRCRNLTSEQIAEFKKKKIEPSIRFKVDGTEVIINDLIRGEEYYPQ
jgi:glutamyl/glutaminyl-tRNA synthetase